MLQLPAPTQTVLYYTGGSSLCTVAHQYPVLTSRTGCTVASGLHTAILNNLIKLDTHRRPEQGAQPFAAMLVFTIECIYEQLDSLDVQCMDVFSAWFAHHLSNQTPAWAWDWSKW
jgi:hypothetical protein